MPICLSPNGGIEASGNTPLRRLLVATIAGIHTLERDESDKWKVTAHVLPELQIGSLLYEPRSGKLFAGAHGGGGLWCSDDEGKTWAQVGCGLDLPHIYTIAVQYREDRTVLYVGTEPVALFRSDDLGKTWREHPAIREVPGTEKWIFPPPPHIAHVKHVAFHPSEPETLYVCIEQGALLKSVDDGASWFELASFASSDDKFYNDTHRVVISPTYPRRIYMATGEGFYASADGGETWEHLTTRHDRVGYPDALFIDPRDERVLIMGGSGEAPEEWRATRVSDATVLRSADQGRTWQTIDRGLPNPMIGNIEAMTLYHHGDAISLIAGTATGEVWLSEEAGGQWTCIGANLPPISKAGHYRWFLSEEQRNNIEAAMRGWRAFA
jgi:photosystem II stability/assembly factor-like uncharacterized protein